VSKSPCGVHPYSRCHANHKNGSINVLTVVALVDGVVQVGEFNVDRHQRGEVAEGLLADDALGPGGAVHFALRVVLAPCHQAQHTPLFCRQRSAPQVFFAQVNKQLSARRRCYPIAPSHGETSDVSHPARYSFCRMCC
jgi:hypothetical protein